MSARALVAALAAYCLLLACSTTDLSGSNGKKSTASPTPKPTVPSAATGPAAADATPTKVGRDDGDAEDKDDDEPSDAPEKAVTVGSFTVWTVPSDPKPFHDYYVYIQVKVPSSVATITQDDLSGRLVGTDSYVQQIGRAADGTDDQWAQEFKAKGKKAILRMLVPGSYKAVRDTIEVRSDALNEEQSISIVF
jgi:hypothetical protein